MRSLILSMATLVVALYGCNTGSRYTISGDIEGLTGKIYLNVADQKIDSTEVTDGKFTFNGNVAAPEYAYIATDDMQSGVFFIENAKIELIGSVTEFESIKVSGTAMNDSMVVFRATQQDLIMQYNTKGTTDEQKEAIYNQLNDNTSALLDANIGNLLGAFIFNNLTYDMTYQQIEQTAARFSPQMQSNKYIKKALEQAAIMRKTAIGQPYIDFEMPDASGTMLKLSTFVGTGKYVLLDFWASWCMPCMSEVPVMAQAYKKYHSRGFEIFGVSLDSNRDAWLRAVETHKMAWVQTSLLTGWDNSVAQKYAVRGIPTNLLISPEGVIVAKNLRGEELQAKLKELIK